MGYENYISETEAAHLAGVSVNTLNRFVEAGYLQTESDSDGLRMFSKSELTKVFGIPETPKERAPETTKQMNGHSENGHSENGSMHNDMTVEAAIDPIKIIDVLMGEESAPIPKVEAVSIAPAEHTQRVLAVELLQEQITRFRNITDLQEKLLTIKDSEIQNLKGEVSWLRGRIEKLEEKGDRDQLLLLAESQTVRSLAQAQAYRKSSFRQALEWFGLLPPTKDMPPTQIGNSQAIEVGAKKEGEVFASPSKR